MSMDAGQILDAVILILLCVTIFYAARLSMFLNHFRESRDEFDTMMGELSRNIQRAEQAIANMRNMSSESGSDLNTAVKEAKFLSDELRFMTDAGDNLATRLEKLAERNRELIDLLENAGGIGPGTVVKSGVKSSPYRSRARIAPEEMEEAREMPPSAPSFFKIHDRDFDRADEDDADAPVWSAPGDDAPAVPSDAGFQSQAEKDLYEALQKGKQKSKAGGVA